MKLIKLILFLTLLVIFVLHLVKIIYNFRAEYLLVFDYKYWEERYNTSQWKKQAECGEHNPHINPKTCVWDDAYYQKTGKYLKVKKREESIGDDGLYVYAAWNYITGGNPALLNAEIPPLGKYLIGIGEIVFKNQNILILIIGLLCLGVFYLLNLKLFKDKIIAFLPVFLFSFDSLYTSQLRAPYLDTTYLLFLLLTLYFTLSKKYILAAIFLGCFTSTKFPPVSVFLFMPILIWVYIFDRKNIKKFIFSMLVWPAVFVLTYFMYFLKGGSLLGFLSLQKWIVNFYSTGAKTPIGTVFPLLLFGKWNTWFSGAQTVSEWTIFWPISFIGSIFSLIAFTYQYFKNGKKIKIEYSGRVLIALWVISYLLFLTFTPVFPRYLLLLLPFMYNLTIWFLTKYVFQRY